MVTLEDTLSPLLGDLVEDVVGTPMAMVHSFLLSDSLLVGGWLSLALVGIFFQLATGGCRNEQLIS
jgi:hypothetical protein